MNTEQTMLDPKTVRQQAYDLLSETDLDRRKQEWLRRQPSWVRPRPATIVLQRLPGWQPRALLAGIDLPQTPPAQSRLQ